MSPRAAWRLESLGFGQVFDYEAGKADSGAAGLPREGTITAQPSAGELAVRDAPICHPTDDLSDVRARVRAAGWDICLVLNEERVVLGRLGRKAITAEDGRSVEEAMADGPSTIRPNTPAQKVLERLTHQNLQTAVVTTSDGRLVGVLRRADAEPPRLE
jgi:CBS domain-containing protein